jgi:hypothetical protein
MVENRNLICDKITNFTIPFGEGYKYMSRFTQLHVRRLFQLNVVKNCNWYNGIPLVLTLAVPLQRCQDSISISSKYKGALHKFTGKKFEYP